jgi:hypothetical protein
VSKIREFTGKIINQSMNTSLNGEQLANDIWAMLGASSAIADNTNASAADNQPNAVEQSEMSDIPDLANEILGKLEQKRNGRKTTSRAVETLRPFSTWQMQPAREFWEYNRLHF